MFSSPHYNDRDDYPIMRIVLHSRGCHVPGTVQTFKQETVEVSDHYRVSKSTGAEFKESFSAVFGHVQ
jgi:hypothetical protein